MTRFRARVFLGSSQRDRDVVPVLGATVLVELDLATEQAIHEGIRLREALLGDPGCGVRSREHRPEDALGVAAADALPAKRRVVGRLALNGSDGRAAITAKQSVKASINQIERGVPSHTTILSEAQGLEP